MENKFETKNKCVKKLKYVLLLTFIFISLSGFSNDSTYEETKKFTFRMENAAIKKVFDYIESNSDYVFLYSGNVINPDTKVSIQVTDETIYSVLDKLLKTRQINYVIKNRQITLEKAPVKKKGGKPHTIQGVVYDGDTKEPIIGATIAIKGQNKGVTTGIEGDFKLDCTTGDVLSVSCIGYNTKDIEVVNLKIYAIELNEAAAELGEVVVTAFGVGQKKESLVGSVQMIKPQELKVPSSSLSTAFAGRMAGVIAVQRSGEPGADGANFWIRGKATFSGATGALIVLDGVEITGKELNALDPEAIESFSILKDATATALYGTRGANGVMIVTTKNGSMLDKPIINFRIEGAMSQMTKVPKTVDGSTYMNLYNEAASRPNSKADPYSEDKINGTINRLNPYIYPNVDWYNEIFKNNSFSERINFNIRGGSKVMDYFMSASFKHNDGHLKSISKDYFSFNNNINVRNYDFINNLNIKATRTTKVSLGLNLSITDWKGPKMAADDIFQLTKEANPVDFPVKFPSDKADYDFILWGDKPGGTQGKGWYGNPIAEYVTGYQTSLASTITANFKLTQELDMITKGLKFSGLYSFKNTSVASVIRSGNYNHFYVSSYDPQTMDYGIKRIGDENGTSLANSGSTGGNRRMYFQAILDYNRVFDEVHDVNAMVLYNHSQYDTNTPSNLYSSLPQRKQGIAGRLSYAYAGKYFAEANFGYNGSENFAKGHRFGFFPSLAIGYNISQEKFWEPIKPYISNLKFRGSWGLVGNDNIGSGQRFGYLEDLVLNSTQWFYTGIKQNIYDRGPVWNRYYNPGLIWEVGEKINLGIDLQLFNDLNIAIDLFKENRRNIFETRVKTLPEVVGTGETKIYSNTGEMENKGIDVSLDYNKQLTKDFFLSFKGTFTFAQNKILKMELPSFLEYPGLSDIGKPTGLWWGYMADGLFPDQATIDGSPKQNLGFNPMPGDIKYINQPNYEGKTDGEINANDRVALGYPTDPEIIYGFGPSIKWKNWDASLFFQGVARTSLMMHGFHPFGTTTIRNMAQFIADDHWSTDNPNPNAAYPRLSKESNSNNDQYSSFWLRNGAFLKLKNAEIGYTLKNMRFYISGANLLTFSPFKLWDPEMGGGNGLYYPTQRVWNIGFQMTINGKK